MEKINKIPTIYESTLKIINGEEPTSLDEFVVNYEPLSAKEKASFRLDLLLLIKEIQGK